ncbi:MAG TPA: hypothetical protein VJT84_10800 [Gaiellaceae bacterium]|nr:hypothetical protein [Gaiellaceae bacterium]
MTAVVHALVLLAAAAPQPSLHLGTQVAAPGASIPVSGNAGDCPVGDRVTILARAFTGPGFAGVGGPATAVRRGGSFSTVAHVSRSAAPGRYLVTARCGGGNLGFAIPLYVTRAPRESVRLTAASVRGTVSYQGVGKGTFVWVRLSRLPARASVRVLLQAGTCARPSASFAVVGSGRATRAGAFASSGLLRFRGASVEAATVADGRHVFAVVANGRRVACAPIPGIS